MLNTRIAPKIDKYLKRLIKDYRIDSVQTDGTIVGICEIVGIRNEDQEDTIIIDTGEATAKFVALNKDEQQQVMKKTFAELQTTCGEQNPKSGSCASITTGTIQVKEPIAPNTIPELQASVTTSYVGDSVSFLIVLSEDNEVLQAVACNPAIHNALNETEYSEITEGKNRNKGRIFNNRLNGSLAVTRAIGDNHLECVGLLHIPQVTNTTCTVRPKDKVFLIACCDGIMEHHNGSFASVQNVAIELAVLIARRLRTDQAQQIVTTLSQLSELIVNNGYIRGSTDNITSLIVQLTTGKSITFGVFDGHAGNATSLALRANFTNCFRKQLGVSQEVTDQIIDDQTVPVGFELLPEPKDNIILQCIELIQREAEKDKLNKPHIFCRIAPNNPEVYQICYPFMPPHTYINALITILTAEELSSTTSRLDSSLRYHSLSVPHLWKLTLPDNSAVKQFLMIELEHRIRSIKQAEEMTIASSPPPAPNSIGALVAIPSSGSGAQNTFHTKRSNRFDNLIELDCDLGFIFSK